MENKKKKGLRWLFLGIVLGVFVSTVFLFAERNGMIHQYYFPGQSQAQGFMEGALEKSKGIAGHMHGQPFMDRGGMRHAGMGHGPNFGHFGDRMGSHHGFQGNYGYGFGLGHGLGGFFFVVGGLLLALTGRYVRGKSKRKWLGNALIVLGVLMLLPRLSILPLVLIGLIGYLLFKEVRPGDKFQTAAPVSFQQDVSINGQFLDEWERKNKREDQ
ncbi:hypothetical protein D1B31_07875 [Neobacillus notoginsengisoli]|uniref:Uncharacterized protein n=1 Tax=Neobacillus notoginsengisoli TaxID=1578198 RepID=A0A417YWA8_9BACI|nr:hypothetical protein [Neobacillus notoginsengisoli]RHW41626.1 hypothetical protein D1B31_07875 [Neobacillus notoginsengisoli]